MPLGRRGPAILRRRRGPFPQGEPADHGTGFAWVALLAFIRLATNSRIYATPLPTGALDEVAARVEHAAGTMLALGRRHFTILRALLDPRGTASNLTTDADLAALAIEHDALLCSADRGSARFEGFRWSNPLAA